MKKVLTIAGSDTSGGAGIAADLTTFQELDVYGMSAITVLVAQNPANQWSHDTYPISLEAVEAQLDTVLAGIGVDAAKTGMLPTVEIIELVARKLQQYPVENLVIDPVMVCKGTDEVVNPIAAEAIQKHLLPLAKVAAPNVFEAAQLSGIRPIQTVENLKEAAKIIHSYGAENVFLKGGTKLAGKNATDVFYDGNRMEVLESPKIETTYNHGAGCTTAAAIAAYLAKGYEPFDAVRKAKEFVTAAIASGFPLNKYVGSVRRSGHCLSE